MLICTHTQQSISILYSTCVWGGDQLLPSHRNICHIIVTEWHGKYRISHTPMKSDPNVDEWTACTCKGTKTPHLHGFVMFIIRLSAGGSGWKRHWFYASKLYPSRYSMCLWMMKVSVRYHMCNMTLEAVIHPDVWNFTLICPQDWPSKWQTVRFCHLRGWEKTSQQLESNEGCVAGTCIWRKAS